MSRYAKRPKGGSDPQFPRIRNVGAGSVMCLRKDGEVYCHLGNDKSFRYGLVNGWGQEAVLYQSDYEADAYCDDCVEAAGDAYMQMQIYIMKGK